MSLTETFNHIEIKILQDPLSNPKKHFKYQRRWHLEKAFEWMLIELRPRLALPSNKTGYVRFFRVLTEN